MLSLLSTMYIKTLLTVRRNDRPDLPCPANAARLIKAALGWLPLSGSGDANDHHRTLAADRAVHATFTTTVMVCMTRMHRTTAERPAVSACARNLFTESHNRETHANMAQQALVRNHQEVPAHRA